jgi:hypothetical protein
MVWRGWFVDDNDNNKAKGWSLPYVVRQTLCGRVADAPRAPCAAKKEREEEEDYIDVWLADYASYLNRPLHAIIIEKKAIGNVLFVLKTPIYIS